MKKVPKEKKGKMDFSELSTSELAVFSAKVEQQLGELQATLHKLGKVRANGMPAFDADSKYSNKILGKIDELGELHNELHYEIEWRVLAKTGVDMEFEAMSEVCYAIDDKYYQVIQKLGQPAGEAVEKTPIILKPQGLA